MINTIKFIVVVGWLAILTSVAISARAQAQCEGKHGGSYYGGRCFQDQKNNRGTYYNGFSQQRDTGLVTDYRAGHRHRVLLVHSQTVQQPRKLPQTPTQARYSKILGVSERRAERSQRGQ